MPKKPTQEARRLKVAMQTESDYESCAARLKALADPDRLQIVNCLLRGEKTVSGLADELGEPIDKISHHLGVLRAAQLVRTRRQGKFVVYSVPPEIAAAGLPQSGLKTLDLGCCQLELVQPKRAAKGARRPTGRKSV
jgi:DNA-binding transcriptional ArsR family regulator